MSQQPLQGFEGCEIEPPKKVELPPFKYLEVEVTRTENSFVVLKVPQNFDIREIHRGKNRLILEKACKATLSDSDWDNFGWEQDIEYQSVKEVPEKEATAYEVFDVTPLL